MKKLLIKILTAIFLIVAWVSFSRAATATPVTISGIAVAGNTLTVTTSAAHGLSATVPSGFCISGSSVAADNVCGVVLTAPSGTTFTFTLAGGATCSTSCGTVQPMKRIIWLTNPQTGGEYQISYLLWIAISAGVPGQKSAWSGTFFNGTTDALLTEENNALQAGSFVEIPRSIPKPLGVTLAQVQAEMQLDWTQQQSAITSGVQPGAFFGDFFDGVGWLQ